MKLFKLFSFLRFRQILEEILKLEEGREFNFNDKTKLISTVLYVYLNTQITRPIRISLQIHSFMCVYGEYILIILICLNDLFKLIL